MKVYYVEDNTADIELVRRALAAAKFKVDLDVATTLAVARAHLQDFANSYDVILADIALPDGSGLALIADLRRQGVTTPIVVLTGLGDESAAVAAMHAGADDYHAKYHGFAQDLIATLQDVLKRHRLSVLRLQRPLRVLYAEHHKSDIDLTQRYFEAEAAHITFEFLRSGEEVLARLPVDSTQEADFDVLLLDYRLAGRDALDILHLIRTERHLDLPVVLVTGQGDEKSASAAMRFGAADYLVKHPGYLVKLPFTLENAFFRVQLAREQVALRDSERRFRRLAENAQDIIFRFDFLPTPHLSYISPAVEAVLGYTPAECLADADFYLRVVHPENADIIQEAIQHNKEILPINPTRWQHKERRTVWIEQRSSPVYDDSGDLIAIEGVARDITEQKQALDLLQQYYERLEDMVAERTHELEAAQQALRQQERQAMLGQLAAGVGHELRNPLSVMTNAVYYLRLIQPQADAKITEYLDIISAEIKKSSRIIQGLIDLTRSKQAEPREIVIPELLAVVLAGLERPENITVQQRTSPDLPLAWADPLHMDQVFSNLVLNAYQAMPNGGQLTVEAAWVEDWSWPGTTEPLPALFVRVQDTGIGIADDMIDTIFEPLFTTKTHGIGLGLAIAKNLVEANHGCIKFESTEGQGTTFTVWLPISPSASSSAD